MQRCQCGGSALAMRRQCGAGRSAEVVAVVSHHTYVHSHNNCLPFSCPKVWCFKFGILLTTDCFQSMDYYLYILSGLRNSRITLESRIKLEFLQLTQEIPESNWNSNFVKFQLDSGKKYCDENQRPEWNWKKVDWLIMWQQTPGLAWFWFQFQSGISRAH